ncbi:ATP-binding protein [Granulosicoccaceae sp. 1_MG-2023]|nr:ATP-binding protein [Granulosicoccaceae sp. 1_MG-2023]
MNNDMTDQGKPDTDQAAYCRFFGLLEMPFETDFDMGKFYQGANRISVFEDVLLQIRADRPVVWVSGARGSGRTTLCRKLEQALTDSLCFFTNFSRGCSHQPLQQQLESALSCIPNSGPQALDERLLNSHGHARRIVIFVEGVSSLSADEFSWLAGLQADAESRGIVIALVFLYEKLEEQILIDNRLAPNHRKTTLVSLSEYEVYEYLNDHLYQCGHRGEPLFRRSTSRLIAKDTQGNFAALTHLAKLTLRRAWRRRAACPLAMDVPLTEDSLSALVQARPESHSSDRATFRSALVVGAVSGALMLALIWGMFGNTTGNDLLVVNELSQQSTLTR